MKMNILHEKDFYIVLQIAAAFHSSWGRVDFLQESSSSKTRVTFCCNVTVNISVSKQAHNLQLNKVNAFTNVWFNYRI